jgi:ankyrin repeat protein
MEQLLIETARSGDLSLVLKYDQRVWGWGSYRKAAIHAFSIASGNGHFEVALWLHAIFGLTSTDARASENSALRLSCANGRLEFAQWLHATFELTPADARTSNNFALSQACANGHLEVARWLHHTFGLTADDARANGHFALHWACAFGRLQVAKWLCTTYDLKWPSELQRWSRSAHSGWYWLPHTLVLGAILPHDMLNDVLQALCS